MSASIERVDVRDVIAEVEKSDDPREGIAVLSERLRAISERGDSVPDELLRIQERLMVECWAESQGR